MYAVFLIICSVQLKEGTVTSLLEENGTIKGVHYKTKDGQEFSAYEEFSAYAPLTIVCDGCFSNLRRSLCNPKVRILFQLKCMIKFPLLHCPTSFSDDI